MRTLTLICAAAIAVCGMVQAQNSVDRISVHFATPVMVGETTLPAGDCSIQIIRGSSVVLEFRSASDSVGAILVPVSRFSDSDVVTDGHAKVIFNRHNDKLQLDQIVFPDHTGFQVAE